MSLSDKISVRGPSSSQGLPTKQGGRALKTEWHKGGACGKAIIAGEHAAVYGAYAVAMPLLGHVFQVELSKEKSARARVDFSVNGKRVPRHVSELWLEAMAVLKIPSHNLVVRGQTTIPVGAGLGSSATLCVGALRALTAAFDIKISRQELAVYANQLEKRFHGTPSGLDTSVVAHESVVFFRKGEPAIPVVVPGVWEFAIVDSGLRASTISMINLAAPYFAEKHRTERVAAFDELARLAKMSLEESNLLQLATAMKQSQLLLRDAGVVGPDLSSFVHKCLDAGALAAKITGAGGGGCVLALLNSEDEDQRDATLARLRADFSPSRVFHIVLGGTSAH